MTGQAQTLPDNEAHDPELAQLMRFLDRDGDGLIASYEGAEAMLLLSDLADRNADDGVDFRELRDFLEDESKRVGQERVDVFNDLDADRNGALSRPEVPEDFRGLLKQSDQNGDGQVSLDEWLAAEDVEDSGQALEQELLEFLKEVDQDGDGAFALADVPARERPELEEEFLQLDVDGNGLVTKQELFALLEDELREAAFDVEGHTATMSGVIGPTTPGKVLELVLQHPEVEMIVMLDVPGSMDDGANLRAAQYVRRHGLATSIPANGEVASGGTDFFLAGVSRTAEPGARFGVHSWSGAGEQGADVPRDDPEHQKYLDYYREMETPEAFYWYTLEAASADDIHWMTRDEIDRYGVLTAPMDAANTADGSAQSPERPGAEFIDIDTSNSPNGVVLLPGDTPRVLRETFSKYTRIVAPNGRPIHFFAQAGVSDEQLVRAREVMSFYLADAPGTRFGADKTAVANAMADNRAALVYFNTERDAQTSIRGDLGDMDLFFQDLYAEESVVEGSRDYLQNSVRDATLEEVFHLVQGAGIRPALPIYHARIEEAMRAAVAEKRWFTNDEWEREGSSSFEYIISVIDVYYGLWGHDPDGNGESFHGEYRYCTRSAIEAHDALGVEVLREFLPANFSFKAALAAEFEGVFHLTRSPQLPYTLKSQYLTEVHLTGEHASGLHGNEQANILVGNGAANVLTGHGGDDHIIGQSGEDVAVFAGVRTEYVVQAMNGLVVVTDTVPRRDGVDHLTGIEVLRFADGDVASAEK